MKKTLILLVLCILFLIPICAQTKCGIFNSEDGTEYAQLIEMDDYYYYASVFSYKPGNGIYFYFLQNPLGPYGSFSCLDFGSALFINNGINKVKMTYDKEKSEEATNKETNTYGTIYIYKTEDIKTALNVLGYGYYYSITGTKNSLSDWTFSELVTFVDLCELLM